MRHRALFAIVVTISLTGCKPDPNEAANAIFVGAQSQMAELKQISRNEPDNLAQQIELLTAINTGVIQILEEYPGSDLAVKFAIGPVGDISPDLVRQELSDLKEEQACSATIRACALSMALEEFKTVPPEDVPFLGLLGLAELHYEAENHDAADAAKAVAEARLHDGLGSHHFDRASSVVASIQQMLGDHDAALTTIGDISKPLKRAEKLTQLAIRMVEENPDSSGRARKLMSEARTIVERSGEPIKRCWLSKADARFEVHLGSFVAAGRIGNEMEDSNCAIDSLYFSALAAKRAEQTGASNELLTLATRRATNVVELERPFWALSRIAELRLELGAPEWQEAFQIAHELARTNGDNQGIDRFHKLFEMARDAGDMALASEILDEMLHLVPTLRSDKSVRVRGMSLVAAAHLDLGKSADGLAVIDANLKGAEQARAKIHLAYRLIDSDNTTLVDDILNQAESAALVEPDRKVRNLVLSQLAVLRLDVGNHDTALRLAREAQSGLDAPSRFPVSETRIAEVLFRVGEIEEALTLLQPFDDASAYSVLSNSAIRSAASDADLEKALKKILTAHSIALEPKIRAALLDGMISGWIARNWKLRA